MPVAGGLGGLETRLISGAERANTLVGLTTILRRAQVGHRTGQLDDVEYSNVLTVVQSRLSEVATPGRRFRFLDRCAFLED